MIFLFARAVSVLWSLALLAVLSLSLPLAFAVGRGVLLAGRAGPTPTTKGTQGDNDDGAVGVPWAAPPVKVAGAVPISTYSSGLLLGLLYFAYYFADALLKAAATSPSGRREQINRLLKPVAKLSSGLETPAVVGSLYLAFWAAFAPDGLGSWLRVVRWVAVGPWAIYLSLLGPVFALLEAGIAVILSQLAGQRCRELVHNGNDALGHLFVAGCLAIYYYAARTAYAVLNIHDLTVTEGCLATLLITVMQAITFAALYTSRGTIVDASLTLAYVMYSIRHASMRTPAAGFQDPSEMQQLTESVQDFLQSMDLHLASGSVGHLLGAVRSCLGTDALTTLAFRVAVFLVFVKVLPTLLARKNWSQDGQTDSVELKAAVEKLSSIDNEDYSTSPSILSKARIFAMPVVIAYYTQSLFTYYLQEQVIDPHVWRWAAAMAAVGLYGIEMAIRSSNEFEGFGGGIFFKEE